jgi:WD40 repeat protein
MGWTRSGLLAFVGGDNTVRLWNPAYKREVAPTVQFNWDVRSLAFSPDGLNLAVCDGYQITILRVSSE